MAEQYFEPIDSIIGEKAEFNGDFKLHGSLRIDGILSGNIVSESKIIVGITGHVKTNIRAKNVLVAGRVDGNIFALHTVELLEDSKVFGDIVASNLVMHDGVIFEGRARIRKIENSKEFFTSHR